MSTPTALLVEVAGKVTRTGARLRPVLDGHGVRLVERSDPDATLHALASGEDGAAAPLLVLLGPGLPRPLSLARRLSEVVGRGQLVFLTDGDGDDLHRRLESPVLMIAGHWSVIDLGSPVLERELERALMAARSRIRLRTTLDRMNARLAEGSGPGMSELARFTTSRRFLADILEHARDAVIAVSGTGTVVMFNPAAEAIFGIERARAVGTSIATIGEEGWEEAVPGLVREVMEGERASLSHELTCRCRDGGQVDLDLTISRIESDPGEDGGVSIVARDVTDRNRLEEQLQNARKLESLGVMAAGIAHEFNNLLTAILGHAELTMLALPEDSRAVADVEEIRDASRRAALLCQRMLAFGGGGRYQLAPLDLVNLVRDCVREVRVGLDPGIEIDLRTSHDVPEVVADGAQLRGVFVSLLRNAAEALDDGDGRITVSIRLERLGPGELAGTLVGDASPGTYVEVEIEDDGSGMDEATLQSAFDPFFSTRFTGRGLGLPAALGVIRAHGGTLSVASAPSVGTRVRVMLPA